MPKTILFFPGQGSQYVGMGRAVAVQPCAMALLSEASDVLSLDMKKLLFEGPERELKKTENTQPALFTVSMMVLACLRELEMPFNYVAGHSLGEYSALCASGVFSFGEGLKLVRLRGKLMAEAGYKRPGAMSAIIGLAAESLNVVLAKAQSSGTVVVANYNSLTQTVISGEQRAVAKAEDYCREAGAAKVVRIPVGGAFHSPLMAFAQEGLEQGLADTVFSVPDVPVITNVDAEPCESPDSLKAGLIRQLVSPVRWVESFRKAVSLGCSHGLEVGPSKVLMGLGRGISREMKILPVESQEQLEKARELLL